MLDSTHLKNLENAPNTHGDMLGGVGLVCHSDPEYPEYGFPMGTKYCGVKGITKESS